MWRISDQIFIFIFCNLSICCAAAWHVECLCSCISVFESVWANGEVVCMVEEASPVWCTNGLVTRNHNVMKKKNNKPQPNSYNHDVQTNKNLIPLKDLERNNMRLVWRPQSCYIMSGTLSNIGPKMCNVLNCTKERKKIQIHKCFWRSCDLPASLWIEVWWVDRGGTKRDEEEEENRITQRAYITAFLRYGQWNYGYCN